MNTVVTGLGLVTPLAASREFTWTRLLAGETGIRVSSDGLEARVYDFSPNGARSRMGDFALLAAREAMAQSRLDPASARIGCAVSQSKPVVHSESAPLDPSLLLSSFFGWAPAQVLQRDLHLSGPTTNVIAACATGIASIATGLQWLSQDLCDAVLVGASESSLNSFYRAGFEQLGVLASSAGGIRSIRPFDRARCGFAMGEGAAVLVLERADSARRRGASALAAVENLVLRQSANDSMRFDDSGERVARLIRDVCGLRTPDYVNAHGTGTIMNDQAEADGLKRAFGPRISAMKVSSTKAATGHLLGAAGAVEAALTVLALRDQMAPPTLHLEHPIEGIDFVPNRPAAHMIERAMSLSYGFGGQMGAVVFSRCN